MASVSKEHAMKMRFLPLLLTLPLAAQAPAAKAPAAAPAAEPTVGAAWARSPQRRWAIRRWDRTASRPRPRS